MPSERATSGSSCEAWDSARSKTATLREAPERAQATGHRARLPAAPAPPWRRADDLVGDAVQLQQLHRLRVLARRHLDVVTALAEERDQRPEERHLRRVRDVDPDAHGRDPSRSRISFAYGHAPTCCVLRGRRAPELLPGGRPARRHAAGRVAAGARAREAARHAAPRPLGASRRADRGGLAALSRRAADARARGPARGGGRGVRRGRARRRPRARRLDRARRPSSFRSCSASSSARTPDVRVFLTVSDTHSVVERVAARELELGIVGAARRHRGVRFEPFFSDEVILVCPPGPSLRGSDGDARRAPRGAADPHAGGRGRQADRGGRAAPPGDPAPRSRRPARARPPGVRSPCGRGGVRRDVHLAHGGRVRPRGGRLAESRVEGLEATREISLASATGRARTRVADAFVDVRARAAVLVIVRWGLGRARAAARRARHRAAAARHERALRGSRSPGREPLHRRPAPRAARRRRGGDGRGGETRTASSRVGGGSAIDTAKAVSAATGLPLVAVPTTYAGSEWTPYFGMRDEARRAKTGGSGANTVAVVYEPALTLDLPRDESVGTAMNALAHCAEALYAGPCEDASIGARADRDVASGGRRPTGATSRRGRGCSRARCTRAWRSPSAGSSSPTRWRRRSAVATASRTAR